jgi:flagellar motor switch protein FliN/FliY
MSASEKDMANKPAEEKGAIEVKKAELEEISPDAPPQAQAPNLQLILDIPVPVSVELGRTSLKIQELLDLHPGAVVELDRLAGEPVDVLVNGKRIAQGEVVVVGDVFGVRISAISEPAQRLRSLDRGVNRAA